MDTAEQRESPWREPVPGTARGVGRQAAREPEAAGRSGAPAPARGELDELISGGSRFGALSAGRQEPGGAQAASPPSYAKPLWIDDPSPRRRMADPVRTSAVRAVLIVAVTLVQAVIAFLCTLAGSWLAFPMVISSVASTVVATWGVLDVWITRQVWNQRNGVVSVPSSSARQLRRERRRARREARSAERAQERIPEPQAGLGRATV